MNEAEASAEIEHVLLAEVSLPSARGRREAPLTVEVVRALTLDDVPTLKAPPPVGSAPPTLLQLRHSHHALARVLAAGHSQEECALITGYDPAYISNIKNDPAFAELLGYYAGMKEQVFVDVLERMKVLGLSSLDELQRRLEVEPEGWTKRELMELSELMLVKSGKVGPGPTKGAGVAVEIKFVAPALKDVTPSGPLIDGL